MIRAELIERSPLRSLEKSIHGGLGKGKIAVLASPKGVGKTACLVHIAMDKLFQGKPVIHVSYASRVDYIITWYEDIFKEITKKMELGDALDVHDEIVKNRVIMNFSQEGTRTEQILRSLEAMIRYGRFAADTIIVDGYAFSQAAGDDLKKFKDFAFRMGLEVWFSASLRGEGAPYDEKGIPVVLQDCLDGIDVLITLHSKESHVRLHVVKDHDFPAAGELPLKLDPKTLLLD